MTERFGFEGYFEDFEVGAEYAHARGKTVSELDGVLITNMVLNTAQAHFNEHHAQLDPMFGKIIVYGGVTISMTIGLAAQDTARHAIRELSMDKIRLYTPVRHGDTIYAFSRVLACEARAEEGGGIVTFLHRGFNQIDKLLFSGERRVLVRSRPA